MPTEDDLTPEERRRIQNELTKSDLTAGFIPAMIFQATGTDTRSSIGFGAQLHQQNLGNTPTNQADFTDLINLYDAL